MIPRLARDELLFIEYGGKERIAAVLEDGSRGTPAVISLSTSVYDLVRVTVPRQSVEGRAMLLRDDSHFYRANFAVLTPTAVVRRRGGAVPPRVLEVVLALAEDLLAD